MTGPTSSPAPGSRTAAPRSADVVVLGGGLAGLAAAWEAASAGASVLVVDDPAGRPPASRVAAGMLAPATEAELDDPAGLALGLAAAAAWPAFAARLEAASGLPVPLRRRGTLVVARDADEAVALDRLRETHDALGLDARRLLPSAARRLEPSLAPAVRAGLDVPGDHALDPRAVVVALRAALGAAGATLVDGRVERVEVAGDAVAGVVLAGGLRVAAPAVVLAAGAWSGGVGGLPDAAALPVRPVKGQLVVLRDPGGPGRVERVLRWGGHGGAGGRGSAGGYLVPRDDGRYVLGATVEEQGFDLGVTAWALHDLLREGAAIVPGLLELELDEALAGLRPTLPDGLPAIGPAPGVHGLAWCTGHHRNGALLAPLAGPLLRATGALGGPTDAGDGTAAALVGHVDPARFGRPRGRADGAAASAPHDRSASAPPASAAARTAGDAPTAGAARGR